MEAELKTIENTMTDVINKLKKQPGFPHNYCNIASQELLKALKTKGITGISKEFSYQEDCDCHTFLTYTTEKGKKLIIDPSYSQYDPKFEFGFIGEHFPISILETHRINSKKLQELQHKRFQEGKYNNPELFK